MRSPPLSDEIMKAPSTVPQMEPTPPLSEHPPMTAATMVSSSTSFPVVEYTVSSLQVTTMPASPARTEQMMKAIIFVLAGETPHERALQGSAPTASA